MTTLMNNEARDDMVMARHHEPLCLEFTNTVGDHASDHPDDHLRTYADLVAWGQRAEIVDAANARHLAAEARRLPAEAKAVLQRAILLRETMYRIFTTLIGGASPSADDVSALNAALDAAPMRLWIAEDAAGFVCQESVDHSALDGILGPIAWSAARLLASGETKWVKQCADGECGWLFLDTTKNHSRRWCDMADCGSRAKAQRYYRRKRAGEKR